VQSAWERAPPGPSAWSHHLEEEAPAHALPEGQGAAAAALALLAAFGGGLGALAFTGAVFGVLAALVVAETLVLGPSPEAEASPQVGG